MDRENKKPESTSELEAERLREREEEGLEPEQHPGPRQNEGISSTGQLYATPEEANPSKGAERTDVDADAAHVHRGEPPRRE